MQPVGWLCVLRFNLAAVIAYGATRSLLTVGNLEAITTWITPEMKRTRHKYVAIAGDLKHVMLLARRVL